MGGDAPENKVQESGLSKEQFKILESREQLYQSYIQPELKDYYKSAKEFSLDDDYISLDHMPGIAQVNMNMAYESQGSDLQKLLSQRGGDSDEALSQLSTRGQLAGANAYNKAQLQAILQNNDLVNKRNQNTLAEQGVRQGANALITSMAPQTTQAAPVYFSQRPEQPGMVAQIGQSLMGAMGSMGSMGGGMGGMMGGMGGGGGASANSYTTGNGTGFM